MKKLHYLKLFFYIISLASFINSCKKDNAPEIIGVSDALNTYKIFANAINDGSIDASAFLSTNDGGLIYVREICDTITRSAFSSYYNLDVSKNLIWRFTYKIEGSIVEFNQLIQLPDGSLILIGNTIASDSFETRNGNSNVVLLKVSRNGKLIWDKKYDISKYDLGKSVFQTSDNGFVLAVSVADELYSWKNDVSIIKTDKNGKEEWSKRFSEKNTNMPPKKIIQTGDNGYLLVFDHYIEHDGEKIQAIKMDQDGNVVKYIGIPVYRGFYGADIIIANDGGYIFSGSFQSKNSEDTLKISLIKIDNSGSVIWRKEHSVEPLLGLDGFEPELFGINLIIRNLLNTGYFILLRVNERYSIRKFNNSGDLIE